jgi:hypothetical protein
MANHWQKPIGCQGIALNICLCQTLATNFQLLWIVQKHLAYYSQMLAAICTHNPKVSKHFAFFP